MANLLRNVWAGRPFWSRKLGQMSRLVWESHAQPMAGEAGQPVDVARGAIGAMFLGHSSFLVGMNGCNLLIDPVLATRLIVLRRQRRAGIRMADVPPIDAVLVTHAHMDHLNRPTLRRVVRATRRLTGRGPVAVVPRGVEDLVEGMGFAEVRTLDWWQSTELPGGLRVAATPCKHWGARIFKDTHRGYCGYMLETGQGDATQRLYHSGDTAYFGGFREIGERLGAPDVALLPIGAYFPDTYRSVHTSPEEAVQGFADLRAALMVPMHFGTFRLGREPMDEPVKRLRVEARRRGIEERVRVLAEGETLVVGGPNGSQSGDQKAEARLRVDAAAADNAMQEGDAVA